MKHFSLWQTSIHHRSLFHVEHSASTTGLTAKNALYIAYLSGSSLDTNFINKYSAQNLQLTVDLPQSASFALLIEKTQPTSGANGPTLSATPGVALPGASACASGRFSPNAALIPYLAAS